MANHLSIDQNAYFRIDGIKRKILPRSSSRARSCTRAHVSGKRKGSTGSGRTLLTDEAR